MQERDFPPSLSQEDISRRVVKINRAHFLSGAFTTLALLTVPFLTLRQVKDRYPLSPSTEKTLLCLTVPISLTGAIMFILNRIVDLRVRQQELNTLAKEVKIKVVPKVGGLLGLSVVSEQNENPSPLTGS